MLKKKLILVISWKGILKAGKAAQETRVKPIRWTAEGLVAHYALPLIDDSLRVLGGSKYLSDMDLTSRYWQVDLSPKDREKCALIFSEGLFEPTLMPQGLCNATATFQ